MNKEQTIAGIIAVAIAILVIFFTGVTIGYHSTKRESQEIELSDNFQDMLSTIKEEREKLSEEYVSFQCGKKSDYIYCDVKGKIYIWDGKKFVREETL